MRISHQIIAHTPSGTPVYGFRMENSTGAYVELTNLGARWTAAAVPDITGRLSNVIMGYENPEDYLTDDFYMGATVGRFANRIAGASFIINGHSYTLERNDGENTNHSGHSGFHRKLWNWAIKENCVVFSLLSPDGEGGYPGNVQVSVEYEWSESHELTIRYHGTTDRPTYLNLTNHAYFNLSNRKGKVTEHLLRIPSHTILDTTQDFIPTGIRTDVDGTPFDFSAEKAIGKDLYADHIQLKWNKGYNHCYILKEERNDRMMKAAQLYEPESGRVLTVRTDLPAVLLYTAGYYTHPHTAVCLETQYYPDTPSHADFPSCLLRPGEEYRQTTIFAFGNTMAH